MQDYIIEVNAIEELQVLKDIEEIERIFNRAKSTIIQGEAVVLMRRNPDGNTFRVDEFTTEAELLLYKQNVLKYL